MLATLINFKFNVINLIISSNEKKIFLMIAYSMVILLSLNRRSGLNFAILFSLIIIAQPILNNATKSELKINYEYNFSLSNIEKRNIYFIGLDALPSEDYYQKHFEEQPFWKNKFENIGFRKINNASTGGAISTRQFYINLFSLKKIEYSLNNLDILNRPLQLHSLIKSLNYRSQFMFHNYLLGSGKNNFFNYNYPVDEKDSNLCPFATPTVGFYLCQEKVSVFFYTLLQGKFPTISNLKSNKDPSINEMMPILLNRIKISATDSVPWVSIFHLWEPGHTSPDYRHNNLRKKSEFQKFFREKSMEATQDALKIIAQIEKYDPNAIIIISGDHGPHLSQGWDYDPFIKNIFSEEERFTDIQGIGLYIYPSDFCSNKIHDGYNSTKLFNDIFKCLNKIN